MKWYGIIALALLAILFFLWIRKRSERAKVESKDQDQAVRDKCMRELSSATTTLNNILEELYVVKNPLYEELHKIKQDISILIEEFRTLEFGAAPFHSKKKYLTSGEVQQLIEYDSALAEECERFSALMREIKDSGEYGKGFQDAKSKIEKINNTLKIRRDIISRLEGGA